MKTFITITITFLFALILISNSSANKKPNTQTTLIQTSSITQTTNTQTVLTTQNKKHDNGCSQTFSLKDYSGYVKKVYERKTITSKARKRIKQMKKCQKVKTVKRTKQLNKILLKNKTWRKSFYCDQNKVINCIRAASKRWNVSFDMMKRKAACESTFNPYAEYLNHHGLYQFLPSTFNTTPYRRKNIYSAKYNSLAAAWMHHVGRGNEWECR